MLTPTYRKSANNIGRQYIGRAVAEFSKVCSHAVLHSLRKLRGTRLTSWICSFQKHFLRQSWKTPQTVVIIWNIECTLTILLPSFSFLESIKGILYHYTEHTSILGGEQEIGDNGGWLKHLWLQKCTTEKLQKKQRKPWGRCYLVRLLTGFKHEWLKNRKKSSW